MKITTIQQELEENGRCLIQTVGVSMEPLLHNRYSSVVLERPETLGKNDVVLFTRGEDFVLHRIIGEKAGMFLIRGDNCLECDRVSREQIIGVMTGFFNGDAFVDCASDRGYKAYVRTLPLRYLYRRCRALAGRVKRRFL